MPLDLTQGRFELYQKVRDLVKSTKSVKYIYVEYKLSIKNRIPKQKGVIFSSISELLDLTDQENNNDAHENEAEGAKVGENV